MKRRGDCAGQVPAEGAEEWLRDLAREGGSNVSRPLIGVVWILWEKT